MMLRALYDLALREGLLENPDFEKKKVDFYLTVDDEGRALGLVPTGEKIGRGQEIYVPRLPKRTVAVTAGFLFDKAEYALGVSADGGERTLRCAAEFRKLVDEAAAAVDDPGLRAVARFLGRREAELPALLPQNPHGPWVGGEMIAFRYAADDSVVHDRPAVRAYWAAQRSGEGSAQEAPRFTCLVTGEPTVPARLHPAIKRIPKAQTSGASVVSFNTDAFASYGLEQGENAPVSRAAAEGYATALNWLLEADPSTGRRFRYGVPVGEDAVLVFWTGKAHGIVDELTALLDGPEGGSGRHDITAVASQVERSVWTGAAPTLDVTPFYVATLSGNARVIVRDWIETTADEVQQSLIRFFADLQLGAEAVRTPLRVLLRAVEAPGRELPPSLKPRLIRAALRGEPFPAQLLVLALQRLRLPPAPNERELLRARVALVRATLNRQHRLRPLPFLHQEVAVSLDENATQVPYLLGRLFAVLEALQAAALGDLNATIRDRFFGAASSTPAGVFPRLLKLSMHHVSKSERRDLERLKSQIVSALPAETFPSVLKLEEQGLFAVGYYHQRESFFQKKAAAKASAAPAASETTP